MTCRLDNGGPGHVAVVAAHADCCAKAAGPEPKLVTQRAKSGTNLLIGVWFFFVCLSIWVVGK